MTPSLKKVRKLLSNAAKVLFLRVGGAALSFLFSVLVSRLLGAEGAGLYFLAFSVMMFTSVLGRLGLDGTILRYIAIHASVGKWGPVRGAFRKIMLVMGAATATLGVLLALGSELMAQYVFGKPELAGPLFWMGLAVIPLSHTRLLSQALKGLNKVATAEAVGTLVQPLFGLMLIYPLVALLGVNGATLAYCGSSAVAAGLGYLLWSRTARRWQVSPEAPGNRELVDSAMPLWLSTTVNQAVVPWAPVALLGLWAATSDVGIFGAANRLANLIAVFLIGVNSVLAPQFAKLQATGRGQDIGPLARQFALVVTAAAMPVFLVLIFAGQWVMGFFGTSFREGGTVLAILAVGQLSSTLCGSVRMVLLITGNEKGLRNASFTSLIVLLALSVLLIPPYGALGAALASAGGTIVTNALPVYFVWKKMGIMTVPGLGLLFRDRTPASGEAEDEKPGNDTDEGPGR